MTVPNGFNKWVGWILEDEGPEVNRSPDEPGNISCYGISLTALSDYNKAMNLPSPTADDVANITAATASNFYSWFFSALNLDQVPAMVAYRIADIVTNLGRVGGTTCVQICLCIFPTTGIMDAATLAAVKAATPATLCLQLDAAWLAWKHNQTATGWGTYGKGWTARVLKVRARLGALT
jgi:lysozyme family protein